MTDTFEIVALALFVFYALGLLCAGKAIMESRTPQGAVAWVLGLITFPYLAVPAYWVFGRNKFHGFVTLLQADHQKTGALVHDYVQELKSQKLIVFPERHESLPVEKLAKLPFTVGNEAELLINGSATFESIFKGIARARKYVLVQFYIVKHDSLGTRLKESMIDKARQGVPVYFLYDEIGSLKLSRQYVADLVAGGVRAHRFNTTKGRTNRFQLNFRNHRKIVVVDGHEAWVGGHNVGDEYLGEAAGLAPFRDTHIRVAGPVAQAIQASFIEDWHWATEEIINLNWQPKTAAGDRSVAALALPSGPEDVFETCTLFFMKGIQSARRRLWIASPYFVPDEQFITALHLAVIRGVDVRILIPEKTDNLLINYTHWAYVERLIRRGIKVYWHQKGFMHQKVVLVDEDFATVGTANFDNRSFRLNFEITVVVASRSFNEEVTRMLENDFRDSSAVTEKEIAKRGFLSRFLSRAAKLTAPVQ